MWIIEAKWDDEYLNRTEANNKRGWSKIAIYRDETYLDPISGTWKSRTGVVQNAFPILDDAIRAWAADHWHPALYLRIRNRNTDEIIPCEIL